MKAKKVDKVTDIKIPYAPKGVKKGSITILDIEEIAF